MRVLVSTLAVALYVPTLAVAETRWAFGWRSTGGTQLGPPPLWLLNGAHWRYRASPHISFAIDGYGGRGDHHEAHDLLMTEAARSMAQVGLGIALHPWPDDTWDARGFAGGGAAIELAWSRMLGLEWEVDRFDFRPYGFAGIAIERLYQIANGKRVGVGLDVRGIWLGGDGPQSSAPPIDRFGIQASLELNAYVF